MFYVNKILFFYFIILIGSTSFADEGYYLTLRNDKVNLRQGPSLNYPIKLVHAILKGLCKHLLSVGVFEFSRSRISH